MKKKLTALMIVLCMLMLAGCGKSDKNTDNKPSEDSKQTEVTDTTSTEADEENEDVASTDTQSDTFEDNEATEDIEAADSSSDILVVYFSRTGEQYNVGVIDKGNTAIVADMIVERTGADVFEILPQEDYYPYTYDELTDVAKEEQNNNARPAYAGEVPDLSQYNTVFVGAPVWWGDWPMIMYTFFEENADALSGKTLIPFSTHAGSGLSGFDSKLAGACPDSTVGTGLAISGADTQNNQDQVRQSVNEWIDGLGY